MSDHDSEVVRLTGLLVQRMTPAQTVQARSAAREHGVPVTQYLRERLVPRMREQATR